jgi:hypothetical protein
MLGEAAWTKRVFSTPVKLKAQSTLPEYEHRFAAIWEAIVGSAWSHPKLAESHLAYHSLPHEKGSSPTRLKGLSDTVTHAAT